VKGLSGGVLIGALSVWRLSRIHAWKQRVLATEGRSVHIDLRPERNAITQVHQALSFTRPLLPIRSRLIISAQRTPTNLAY
jgi:hypothetical protein